MVSVAQGLRMMQGGVDRTGFADMADQLGNPGMDLILQRRAAAEEEAGVQEILDMMAAQTPGGEEPPVDEPEKSFMEKLTDAIPNVNFFYGPQDSFSINEKIGDVIDLFKPESDFEIGQNTKADGGRIGMDEGGVLNPEKLKDEFLNLSRSAQLGLMDAATNFSASDAVIDPFLKLMGMKEGGRVEMQLGGGIMNALLGSSQVQNAFQQYRQPTMDFSQVASSSIPQQTVAPPTPAQAYTPFVSTMPLYDPSTLGTGLPSTAGMADPYTVYDPYSPVGAFDTPKAKTTGFLSREQIDKGFSDLDKFDVRKQKQKKEEEEAKKKKAKKGGGKENYDRFMANKAKAKNTKYYQGKNKSGKAHGSQNVKGKQGGKMGGAAPGAGTSF